VNSETVLGVAELAWRTGAKDLYDFALQFAAAHWEVVHAYEEQLKRCLAAGWMTTTIADPVFGSDSSSSIRSSSSRDYDRSIMTQELLKAIKRVRREGFKPVVASFSMPYSDGSYDEQRCVVVVRVVWRSSRHRRQ